MFRSKKLASTLFIAVLLALAALNSIWGYSQAQTVPLRRTSTPTKAVSNTSVPVQNTPKPPDNTPKPPNNPVNVEPSATQNIPSTPVDDTPVDYYLKKLQVVPGEGADVNLIYQNASAGIVFEAGAFCNSGAAIVALLPNNSENIPGKDQLTFYRPVTRVVLFVKTRYIQEDTCGALEKLTGATNFAQYFPATNTLYRPYFDLSGRERFIYDSMKDKGGIFWYNKDTSAWELCPNMILDESIGNYGRLYCETAKTGLFTLGLSNGTH